MEVRPGYKQTEAGVIPDEWEVSSVGEAFEVCDQLRMPISQAIRSRMEGPYPYYGPTGIQSSINEFRVDGTYALIGEDGDHFLKWRSHPMTLLVSGKFNVNNHAHVVRGTDNLTEWFYWYFAHREITPYLTRQGAGRYKLTKTALLSVPCVIPTKEEQRAIAAALSDADALIESLEQLIAKKRQIKQGAIQELLTGKRRLPGFDREWESVSISDLESKGFLRLSRGKVISKSEILANPGDFPVYSSSILNHGLFGCYGEFMFDEEMITWSIDGGGDFFHRLKHKFSVTNVCGFMRVIVSHIHCGFLAAALKMQHSRKSFDYLSKAHPSVVRNDYSVLLPLLSEQSAIAEVLTAMDDEICALETKLSKASALKQGMMQELLTGRIRLV